MESKLSFFVKLPVKILIYIDYMGVVKKEVQIGKVINCTYSQVSKIIIGFEKAGLVEIERKNRMSKITLTPKGKTIAKSLKSINEILRT